MGVVVAVVAISRLVCDAAQAGQEEFGMGPSAESSVGLDAEAGVSIPVPQATHRTGVLETLKGAPALLDGGDIGFVRRDKGKLGMNLAEFAAADPSAKDRADVMKIIQAGGRPGRDSLDKQPEFIAAEKKITEGMRGSANISMEEAIKKRVAPFAYTEHKAHVCKQYPERSKVPFEGSALDCARACKKKKCTGFTRDAESGKCDLYMFTNVMAEPNEDNFKCFVEAQYERVTDFFYQGKALRATNGHKEWCPQQCANIPQCVGWIVADNANACRFFGRLTFSLLKYQEGISLFLTHQELIRMAKYFEEHVLTTTLPPTRSHGIITPPIAGRNVTADAGSHANAPSGAASGASYDTSSSATPAPGPAGPQGPPGPPGQPVQLDVNSYNNAMLYAGVLFALHLLSLPACYYRFKSEVAKRRNTALGQETATVAAGQEEKFDEAEGLAPQDGAAQY